MALPSAVVDVPQKTGELSAIEAIDGVGGAYSALIADAESRTGTAHEIAEYGRLRTECQRERRSLRAEDGKNVDRVRTTYAALCAT